MSTTTNMWPALGLGIQDLRNDGGNIVETATTTSCFANAATIDDGKRNKQRSDGRGDQKTVAVAPVDSKPNYDDDDRFSSIVDDTTADSACEENAIGTEITIGTLFDNAAAATSSGELSPPSLPPRKMRQQRCRKRAMTPATIEENDDDAVDDRDDDAVAVAAAAKKNRRDLPPADSCEFEYRPEGSTYGGGSESDGISMCDLWSELTGPDATVDDSNVLETDQMFKTVNNDHSMAGVLDGFEMRSVYALLSRIDSAKCVQEYDGLGGERAAEHIRRLVRSVLWSLWRLGRFASRHRFDINLSSRAWLELNETFGGGEEKTAAAATRTEADETKRSLLLGGDDEIEVGGGGGGEPAKERVRTLIGNLDRGVKELILRLVQVRGSKVYEDLLEERLTALNFSDSENKLSYAGYAIGRMRFVQFRNNVAYMNGFYLVSLKPVQLTRVLKYPAYEDRFGYLGQIARQYVKDKIYRGKRIPDRVRIFVNLTTLQACQDFNVLKSLPTSVLNDIKREDAAIEVVDNVSGGKSGPGNKKPIGRLDRSGVLGLVQFGNVRYEPKNEYVVIRGYLAATFSSTCAE